MNYEYCDCLISLDIESLNGFKVKEMSRLFNTYIAYVNSDYKEFFEALGKCSEEIMTREQLIDLHDELDIYDDISDIIGNLLVAHILVEYGVTVNSNYYDNVESYYLSIPKCYPWELLLSERFMSREDMCKVIENGVEDIAESHSYLEENWLQI